METSNEKMQIAKFDPAAIYAGASSLTLTETEMSSLSAPFDDKDYEIRPDGYIYIPQALTLQRLNTVIGIGRWGLLLISVGTEDVGPDRVRVYYDGALMIRNCFVSRAMGESSYFKTNTNQSKASALEAAKTDCRQRCCKDLGIATNAWNPSFIRDWQKKNAIKVFVKKDDGKKDVAWRRKDVDPFWNEVGLVPDRPSVPDAPAAPAGKPVSADWQKKIDACTDKKTLTDLYNANESFINGWKELKTAFFKRRDALTPVV